MGSPIFLVLIPIFLSLGVIIAALFLRAAISLANKVFKPATASPHPTIDLPPDFPGETLAKETPAGGNPFAKTSGATPANKPSDNNPYAAPQSYSSPARASGAMALAIPEPNFGKACGIVLLHFLTWLAAGLVFSFLFAIALVDPAIASLFGLVVGFVTAIVIYGAMLPTTPGRAAVIYLFQLLLMVLAIAVFVAAILAIIALAG